jgi:hypothetical protein
VTAPDICSVKIFWHPASVSASRCKARCWSTVETRAQPISIGFAMAKSAAVRLHALAQPSPRRGGIAPRGTSAASGLFPFRRHAPSRNSSVFLPFASLKSRMSFERGLTPFCP